jgi:uncharacterized protein YcgI (DUF1989 family)
VTALTGPAKDGASAIRPAPEAWVVTVAAGSRIAFTASGPGAGAAAFVWSSTDPYEQLSDAYTFMELRKVRPEVGDHLFSTLRRPILTVVRDDLEHSIDLLRHNHWHPRSFCLNHLGEVAKAKSVRSPLTRDWPYAINIFARTLVSDDGILTDAEVCTSEGSRVELVARCDVVAAILTAASGSRTLLQVDNAMV